VKIDVITLFPAAIEDYCATSVLGRARAQGLVEITALDLRSGADDQRGTVDDTPFGGGAGMVLKPEPIFRVLEERAALVGARHPVIALVPHGRPFDQAEARRLASLEAMTLLCGRYEGIDQRVLDEVVDEEISIGDFVLAAGELAALCVIEAVVRLLPGALGNEASVEDESFSHGLLEYPQWTKPASFRGLEVPEILRSGDHGRVVRWRRALALKRTLERRPDLIEARGGLSVDERALLEEFGGLEGRQPSG
jgi:tRNA (guanine37-N1)-methyltransferase